MSSRNDKAPRIAELLDVDVGEKFRIVGNENITFWINKQGFFETDPPQAQGSSFAILTAINNPNRVIRSPQLTPNEVAICTALGARWVCRGIGLTTVRLWDVEPVEDHGLFSGRDGAHEIAIVQSSKFPSMRGGECIEVIAE